VDGERRARHAPALERIRLLGLVDDAHRHALARKRAHGRGQLTAETAVDGEEGNELGAGEDQALERRSGLADRRPLLVELERHTRAEAKGEDADLAVEGEHEQAEHDHGDREESESDKDEGIPGGRRDDVAEGGDGRESREGGRPGDDEVGAPLLRAEAAARDPAHAGEAHADERRREDDAEGEGERRRRSDAGEEQRRDRPLDERHERADRRAERDGHAVRSEPGASVAEGELRGGGPSENGREEDAGDVFHERLDLGRTIVIQPGAWARMTGMADHARLVGINHVALEVGDIDEALDFYGRIFELTLRGRGSRMAFIDMGDQFIALSAGRTQPPDGHRHLGLVVDDKEAARRALEEAGAEILPGRGLDFRDPWGNRVQVVGYAEVQFTKTPEVLTGMHLDGLEKTPEAREELRAKGLG
jgi:lactoylglutathione lyase